MLTQLMLHKGFHYFYYKKYNTNYSITPTTTKINNSFFQKIDSKWNIHSLGINWLWRYLLFQFLYWEDCEIVSFNSKINFSFIFGEKALQRWVNRDQEFDFQLEIGRKLKYSISFLEFTSLVETNNEEKNSYNSPIRLRNLNTTTGFSDCLLFTTLYDPKDSSCIRCSFKRECKKLLELNYPEIYKSRVKHG